MTRPWHECYCLPSQSRGSHYYSITALSDRPGLQLALQEPGAIERQFKLRLLKSSRELQAARPRLLMRREKEQPLVAHPKQMAQSLYPLLQRPVDDFQGDAPPHKPLPR